MTKLDRLARSVAGCGSTSEVVQSDASMHILQLDMKMVFIYLLAVTGEGDEHDVGQAAIRGRIDRGIGGPDGVQRVTGRRRQEQWRVDDAAGGRSVRGAQPRPVHR
ncbi:hypothetical protein [Micromonospora sp. KC207]|uniref:hypothetical protein n=1 Tax=Micromonospora sp. KC207 TaxID=2530377 RepID=UPI001FB677CE|nr:hypothetical protein [Micromonospora sp. KC207]